MKNQITQRLAGERLDQLRGNAGIFANEQIKKKAVAKLKTVISSALFLDDARRKMWLSAADILSTEEAETLMGAILRENFRWKKGERKIEFTTNL